MWPCCAGHVVLAAGTAQGEAAVAAADGASATASPGGDDSHDATADGDDDAGAGAGAFADEPLASSGMAAALALLNRKGELFQQTEYAGRANDKRVTPEDRVPDDPSNRVIIEHRCVARAPSYSCTFELLRWRGASTAKCLPGIACIAHHALLRIACLTFRVLLGVWWLGWRRVAWCVRLPFATQG